MTTSDYFQDMSYGLGDTEVTQQFDVTELVSYKENADCGEVLVEFFKVSEEQLDPDLFMVTKNAFTVKMTTE